jgi:hypothetical protein
MSPAMNVTLTMRATRYAVRRAAMVGFYQALCSGFCQTHT